MVVHFSQFLRIWGTLWAHLTPAWFFGTLCLDLYRIFVDFGWILVALGSEIKAFSW